MNMNTQSSISLKPLFKRIKRETQTGPIPWAGLYPVTMLCILPLSVPQLHPAKATEF